jgi:serine/threonine-protein kinase RsbW
MLVQFLYLQPPTAVSRKVYAPPQHKGILTDLYQELGFTPSMVAVTTAQDKKQSSNTEFKIKLFGSMHYARMMIAGYGQHTIAAIKAELRQLCLKKIDIVNLFLNLSDPFTAGATVQIEKLGFFFAGILPDGFKDGDALILQYLNNVPIDYDAIQVKSAMAQKLLAYVREQDPNLS